MSTRPFLAAVALLAACGLREIDRHGAGRTVTTSPDGAAVEPEPQPQPDAQPQPPPRPGEDATPPGDGTTAPPARDAAAVDPSGGPGVTIAGKFVPRGKAIVFLHIGHSNMAGRATTPPDLMPYFYGVDPHLWTYAKGGVFRPAKEPTAPDNEAGQAAGPGMAILRSALAVAPDASIISIGHGHSGSFGGYCTAFRKGGPLYDIVMAPATELKGKVTFAAIFTMFGQSEHHTAPAQQKMFADCLVGMAGEMRADLGEPGLPFIVGDYEMGISRADIAPTSAFGMQAIAQLHMVPGKLSRSAIIATEGFPMQDDHHFNMAGHKMWAAAGIKLLIDNMWAPWSTP